MADEPARFNWPPTAEELDSIHVVEMHDTPAESRQLVPQSRTRMVMPLVTPAGEHAPSAWRRLVDSSTVAQTGLLTASLAAIGIAVTSMVAPAQPAAHRGASHDTAPAVTTSAAATAPAAAASATARDIALPAEPATFQQIATIETPPREESPWLKPRRAGSPAVAPRVSAASARDADADDSESTVNDIRPTASERESERVIVASRRTSGSRWTDRRAARRAAAGSDPVSRFAVRTGTSFWKALRVVGRSLKRDDDERGWASRPRARAAIARRTAAAVDLEAGSAPSVR